MQVYLATAFMGELVQVVYANPHAAKSAIAHAAKQCGAKVFWKQRGAVWYGVCTTDAMQDIAVYPVPYCSQFNG